MSNTDSGQSLAEAANEIAGLLESEEETPDTSEQEAESSDDALDEDAGQDSGTDEGSEDESEESDEDEAEADEESDEATALDDSTELEIDGEKVTLAELKAGRLRQADYTKKTMALAEERKTFQAEAKQVRDQYAAGLERVSQFLERIKPTEPDWDKLRKENPAEFAATWAEHERLKQAEAAVEADRRKIANETAEEDKRAFSDYLEEQKQLLRQAVPEWADEAKAKADGQSLIEAGMREFGFSEEELGNVYDHRLVLVLRDALKYREISTKGAEKVRDSKKVVKVLKPGTRDVNPNRGKKAQLAELNGRLKRSGSVKDAARLLEATMPD